MDRVKEYKKFHTEAFSILTDLNDLLDKVRLSQSFTSVLTLRKMNKLTNQLAGAAFVIEMHHIAQLAELLEEVTHLIRGKTDADTVNRGIVLFDRALQSVDHYLKFIGQDDIEINRDIVREINSFVDKLGGARRRLTQEEIDKILKKKVSAS